MERWHAFIDQLVAWLRRIGGAALVGMMTVTCADVVTRYFGRPIFGAVEIVSLMAVVVLAAAMPLTHVEKGHVGVDLVVRKLPPAAQHWVDAATTLVSTALFAIVCWQMFLYAGTLAASGEVSMSLELPTHLFVYAVAVAFGVLALVIFTDFLTSLRKAARS
jgi:TRAP-type C4-dicarboxylate transport system permease small subunit